jgi:nucleotide-binding universal stress UspA family protein
VFGSIVVAVDLERVGDRALPVAQSLGRLAGLQVQIVTVACPGFVRESHVIGLARLTKTHGVDSRSILVLHEDDPASAVAAQLNDCDGALLVMATTARSALGLPVTGSVSEEILSSVRQPVLLVGPHVQEPCRMAAPTLVAAVDGSDHSEAALPVIVSWMRTFGGGPPAVVKVVPGLPYVGNDGGEVDAATRSVAERLLGEGVSASCEVLRGGDPVAVLHEFADDVPESVIVVAAERWPGGHWHRTARELVRWSPRPVLVVPADRPGLVVSIVPGRSVVVDESATR